ncbi:MAG: hypothetical protein H7Y04_05935 [Verrucomicrobia bacterium]|nr:hypothetical protein [Cytophagales bacterium]
MKPEILIISVFVWVSFTCQAQKGVYVQSTKDSTKFKLLRFNRNYRLFTRKINYDKIRLINVKDSTMIFVLTKKPNKDTVIFNFSEIIFVDKSPSIIISFARFGAYWIAGSALVLVATPFVGIFDSWEEARTGLEFSGMLAGAGLFFISPNIFFRSYNLEKKWKLIYKE